MLGEWDPHTRSLLLFKHGRRCIGKSGRCRLERRGWSRPLEDRSTRTRSAGTMLGKGQASCHIKPETLVGTRSSPGQPTANTRALQRTGHGCDCWPEGRQANRILLAMIRHYYRHVKPCWRQAMVRLPCDGSGGVCMGSLPCRLVARRLMQIANRTFSSSLGQPTSHRDDASPTLYVIFQQCSCPGTSHSLAFPAR